MSDVFDPLRILAGLRAHGVSYILVGGLAAAARGSPIETDDVDICLPADDDGNLGRLALALQHLGAQPESESAGEEHRVSFRTAAGRLDCVESLSEYARLDAHASEVDLGRGVVARVASFDDLTRLKRASGDLSSVAHLAAFGSGAEVSEEEAEAADHVPARNRVERIWKALEDVDTFLTNLNNGEPRRQRRKS
jgi:hypothetical protein